MEDMTPLAKPPLNMGAPLSPKLTLSDHWR